MQSLAAGSFGTAKWMQSLEDAGQLDEASIERRRALAELQTSTDTGERKNGTVRVPVKTAPARANSAQGARPRKTGAIV